MPPRKRTAEGMEEWVKDICDCDDPSSLELLFEDGFSINQKMGPYEETILHFAATSGAVKLASHLIENNADIDINAVSKYGQTPLYTAVARRQVEFIQLLGRNKANLDKVSNTPKYTALMLAVLIDNDSAIAKQLLEMGATPNYTNSKGVSALSLAAINTTTGNILLLAENGLVIDTTGTTQSKAISEAIEAKQPANALLLLQLGIPINNAVLLEMSSSLTKINSSTIQYSPESLEQWKSLVRQLEILEKKGETRLNHSSPASSVINSTANLAVTLSLRGIE